MPLAIYRLTFQVTRFTMLLPVDSEDDLSVDGRPLAAGWRSPVFQPADSDLPHPLFYEVDMGGIAMDDRVAGLFAPWFSTAELLPIEIAGRAGSFVMANIMRVVDCLDDDRSELLDPGFYARYEFRADDVPTPGLFKFPPTEAVDIALVESDDQPPRERLTRVCELFPNSGLEFELLWTSDSGSVPREMSWLRLD